MSKPYSYGALPDSSRWIRLLILAPGTFNAPLSIRLKNTNLDAVDAYTALSWRWSKPTETTTLKVDQDETLTISQNLESALQALRDETENVVLWVDQVCINQMDSTEKLLQIPLMGKIYSKARSTVGWLGSIESGSDVKDMERAVHRLQEIGQAGIDAALALSHGEYAHLFDDDVTQDQLPEDQLPDNKKKLRNLSKTFGDVLEQPEYKHIDSLCSLTYFRRGWILQEITIPAKLELRLDNLRIDGDVFCTAILVIYVLVHHSRLPMSQRLLLRGANLDKYVHPKAALRKQYQRGREERFFNLASLLRKNATSEFGPDADDSSPRDDAWKRRQECGFKDRVYGLFGIANDQHNLASKLNYNKSSAAIYSVTTKYIIQEQGAEDTWYGGPNILSLCGSGRPESGEKQLPSWTPDFSTLMDICTFADQTRNSLDAPFNASRGTTHAITDEDQYKEDANILICAGVLLDEVKDVGSKSYHGIEGEEGMNAFFKSLVSIVGQSKRIIARDAHNSLHPHHANAQKLQSTIWRLPVLDCELDTGSTRYRRCTQATYQGFHDTFIEKVETKSKERYVDALIMSKGKAPFLGAKGFVALGPETVRVGDVVCVLQGSAFPFLLRRVGGENGVYRIVGEAFVDGIMDGEALGMGIPCVELKLR